jgi:hypothetical protein
VYCYRYSSPTLANTIIAFSTQGAAVGCSDNSSVTLTCCDIYGNAGGDWVGCIAGQNGINGNFSADPLFCDPGNADFTLDSRSPCLPGSHPDGVNCGLIGALGEGCGIFTVTLDIHPRSCPNPFNIKWLENIDQGNENEHALPKKGGVMPAAIAGSGGFDVTEIDVATLQLEGVAPLRSSFEDVTRPTTGGDECDCTTEGPDGIMDLTLKFSRRDIAATFGPVGNGDVVVLTITGSLLDGTPFEASDCVTILSKELSLPLISGPDQVVLYPAVPNPFNPVTRIRYVLPSEGLVKLTVYDVAGRLLERLVSEAKPAGEYVVEWNAKRFPSGIYFCRIEVGDFKETRKLILLK